MQVRREPLTGSFSPRTHFERIRDRSYPFWLDTALPMPEIGRYSFLGADPFLVLEATGDRCRILRATGEEDRSGDPLAVLGELLERFAVSPDADGVPHAVGAVGYLGYEAGGWIERLPPPRSVGAGLPDLWFAFYGEGITFDRRTGHAWRFRLDPAPGEPIRRPRPRPAADASGVPMFPSEPISDFTREGYCDAVRRALEAIREGEVYQINLSQRFRISSREDPADLYLRLREANPAPFGACLFPDAGGVLSTSPERFLLVEGDRVETRPIKGTRPRRVDPEADRLERDALLTSEKDRAELTMIVDLERNDLGRTCRVGSVRVSGPRRIETYRAVHHTVATVEGGLRSDADRIDLLRATFPGGSITGAPKIRAMEIIRDLEPVPRGPYTGALGTLSFDGRMDLAILIRTVVAAGGELHVHVGGGIVADSDPEGEYEETLYKGAALFPVLTPSGGILSPAGEANILTPSRSAV